MGTGLRYCIYLIGVWRSIRGRHDTPLWHKGYKFKVDVRPRVCARIDRNLKNGLLLFTLVPLLFCQLLSFSVICLPCYETSPAPRHGVSCEMSIAGGIEMNQHPSKCMFQPPFRSSRITARFSEWRSAQTSVISRSVIHFGATTSTCSSLRPGALYLASYFLLNRPDAAAHVFLIFLWANTLFEENWSRSWFITTIVLAGCVHVVIIR